MIKEFSDYDIVIFDCDGVLLDVNLLKCDAFGKAVEGYPNNIVESFVNHCKETFGVSRYVKFKEFFSKFANEQYDDEKYNLFLNRYSNYCRELYNIADLTPSAEVLLSILSKSGKKLFVASGSDEKELIDVFKRRSLIKFFDNIYGSPMTKTECVSAILEKHSGLKAVLIGDAISDLNTAKEHGLDFIYMSKFTVQSKEKDETCRREAKLIISTLEDL